MEIVVADPEDAKDLARLLRNSFESLAQDTYDREERRRWVRMHDEHQLHTWLKDPQEQVLLALDDEDHILGFASRNSAYVRLVYVDPQHARQGIGTALVKELGEGAKTEGAPGLETYPTDNAVPFFEKLGFKEVNRIMRDLDGVMIEQPHMRMSFRGQPSQTSSTEASS